MRYPHVRWLRLEAAIEKAREEQENRVKETDRAIVAERWARRWKAEAKRSRPHVRSHYDEAHRRVAAEAWSRAWKKATVFWRSLARHTGRAGGAGEITRRSRKGAAP